MTVVGGHEKTDETTAAKALVTEIRNESDERLVRSYHPSLASEWCVQILRDMSGNKVWVVRVAENSNISHTHVLDRWPMYNYENLSINNTFTGSLDEQWFYLVSVVIEARSAIALPLMRDATTRNPSPSTTTLDFLASDYLQFPSTKDKNSPMTRKTVAIFDGDTLPSPCPNGRPLSFLNTGEDIEPLSLDLNSNGSIIFGAFPYNSGGPRAYNIYTTSCSVAITTGTSIAAMWMAIVQGFVQRLAAAASTLEGGRCHHMVPRANPLGYHGNMVDLHHNRKNLLRHLGLVPRYNPRQQFVCTGDKAPRPHH
ncbi:hypothetical protein FQN54_005079 [Arachnomyces sp. PD_36]|nr:hypothetical protein FQN54_005079 [Arachnomyces sp. PD_36]